MKKNIINSVKAVFGWLVFFCLLCRGSTHGQLNYERIKSFGYSERSSVGPVARLAKGSDGFFYGTSRVGGLWGRGTVFKLNTNGSGFVNIHSFGGTSEDGRQPYGALIEGTNGFLYGTTSSGGASNLGTIFRMNKDGSAYTVIHAFTARISGGDTPLASLLLGSDGSLYGTSQGGGRNDRGTIFKLSTDGSGFALMYSFASTLNDGSYPEAALIEGSDGMLYGTAANGNGSGSGLGTVFKINKNGTNFSVIHNFVRTNYPAGWNLKSSLLEGSDGALYGTTYDSEVYRHGTIYKLNKDGSDYRIIHAFARGLQSDFDGSRPFAELIEGSDGILYGTTQTGGTGNVGFGTLFHIEKDGTEFGTLRYFGSFEFGSTYGYPRNPRTALLEGNDGALYGTSEKGGYYDDGTIFRVTKLGERAFDVLWHFTRTGGDGDAPNATLTEGRNGILYGSTENGGTFGDGAIFKLGSNGIGYTILKSLSRASGGAWRPRGKLIESDGYLYGAADGGLHGKGVIFKLNSQGNDYTILHNFMTNGLDGNLPNPGLTLSTGGLLYGTTYTGGVAGKGTVFRLGKDGTSYSVLRSFTGVSGDGEYPAYGLLMNSNGLLYGTTSSGGSAGDGTVFRLDRDGGGYSVLHHFDSTANDGRSPESSLVTDADGFLFGTTTHSSNYLPGIVFKISPDGAAYQVIHRFKAPNAGADTFFTSSSIIQATDGFLYGTVSINGGNPQPSEIFKLSKDGTDYVALYKFSEVQADGLFPRGGLLEASDGSIYGVTTRGGDMGFGTIFRFQPAPVVSIEMNENLPSLRFAGQRGRTYEVLRSSNGSGPWDTIATLLAPANNIIEFVDDAPPLESGYYRVRRSP